MGRRVKNFEVDWAQATHPTIEMIAERFDYLSPPQVGRVHVFLGELVPYLRNFAAEDLATKNSQFRNTVVKSKCEKTLKALESAAEFFRDFDLQTRYLQSPGTEWAYSPASRKILERAAYSHLEPVLSSEWVFFTLGVKPTHTLEQEDTRRRIASIVEANPSLFALKILEQLRSLVEDFRVGFAAAAPGGGPRPRTIEPNLITNLAGIYSELGRQPTRTLEGAFHGFAEAIVQLMGCEAGWIPSHLSAGVRHWKQKRK